MTPVLYHEPHLEPGWWPHRPTWLARVDRSASHGTCRQSVPDSTSASGSAASIACGGVSHAVSTSETLTSRPARSSQITSCAFVTPYARKAPMSHRKSSDRTFWFGRSVTAPPPSPTRSVGSPRATKRASLAASSEASATWPSSPTRRSTGSSSSAQLTASSAYASLAREMKARRPTGTRSR